MKSVAIIAIASLPILTVHADEGPEVDAQTSRKVEVSAALQFKFDQQVRVNVVGRLNPKPSLTSRFSRVRVIQPSQYYDAEIVRAVSDELVLFNIVHVDHSNLLEPKREIRETGRYNPRSGKVEIYDAGERAFVPPAAHPLFGGKSAKS